MYMKYMILVLRLVWQLCRMDMALQIQLIRSERFLMCVQDGKKLFLKN